MDNETKTLCYEIEKGINLKTFQPDATQLQVCDSLEQVDKHINAIARFAENNFIFRGVGDVETVAYLKQVARKATIRYSWETRRLVRERGY